MPVRRYLLVVQPSELETQKRLGYPMAIIRASSTSTSLSASKYVGVEPDMYQYFIQYAMLYRYNVQYSTCIIESNFQSRLQLTASYATRTLSRLEGLAYTLITLYISRWRGKKKERDNAIGMCKCKCKGICSVEMSGYVSKTMAEQIWREDPYA